MVVTAARVEDQRQVFVTATSVHSVRGRKQVMHVNAGDGSVGTGVTMHVGQGAVARDVMLTTHLHGVFKVQPPLN